MQKRTRINAAVVMGLVILWLMIPLIATAIYSLFDNWTGIIPHGFTFDNYRKLFTDAAFMTAMYQTLIVCVIPILITIVVMLLWLYMSGTVMIMGAEFNSVLMVLRKQRTPEENLGESQL